MTNLLKISSILALLVFSACNKNKPVELGCIPKDLASDVIAYYPFTNGSLADYSGGEHHLTNIGGAIAAPDREGNATCAFEFDNLPESSQFLVHNNPTFLNGLSSFSVSLWYMPMDPSRDGGLNETLIARDSVKLVPDRTGQWSIGLYDCRRAVFGRTNSVWQDKNAANTCEDIIEENTGDWKHLVVTCEIGYETSVLYLDGDMQETFLGNAGSYVAAEIGDLFIGRNYTGRIDDVMIFDTVLSNSSVKDLYKTVPCCP